MKPELVEASDEAQKTTEAVAEVVSDVDPLEETEAVAPEEKENELGIDPENVEEEIGNELENDLKEIETPTGTELEEVGEETGNLPENDEESLENELENPEEEEQEEIGEPISYKELDKDPLEEEEAPPPGKEAPKSKEGMTDEYKEMLIEWAIDGIDLIDEMKTKLCVAFGGGYASDYAADKKVKKAFMESTREVLKAREVGPPSPMQAFLMALAAMTVPSLLLVGYRRFTKPDLENRIIREKVEATEAPQEEINYKDTTEYKENRTRFKVHSGGAYQYDLDNEYVAADVSDAYPSAEVQKLLDEGKTSSEIKTIIYG